MFIIIAVTATVTINLALVVSILGKLWILAVSGGLQSVAGYLGLTLVFVWDSAPQGGFNCYFSRLLR